MSTSIDNLAKTLYQTLSDTDNKKPKPADDQATVTKVDGDTVWVKIPGGVDETPVRRTVNAKAGDTVQVRRSGGRAWITGNATNPPTDDTRANAAYILGSDAAELANRASEEAERARVAADNAEAEADRAHKAADDADTHASEAKTSATNASEYASRALGNLSTVQNVTETLNWITAHGTMTLTTDTELDPTHVYFVLDENGDYTVGNQHYSVVSEPSIGDISTYYVLSIDESLNNYVASHLALTDAGLDLWQANGGDDYRLHQGTVYADPEKAMPFGVYILNQLGMPLAQFTGSKMQLGLDSTGHITISNVDGHQRIGFWENASSEVAFITESEMNIARTVVLQSMKVGNWQWTAMSSGNLRLQWIGE